MAKVTKKVTKKRVKKNVERGQDTFSHLLTIQSLLLQMLKVMLYHGQVWWSWI